MIERHFTASVYIIDDLERVLLIFHRKIQKWLPPGGHIDPNEMPHEAAIREAKEETGIDIELITQENVWVDESNATSIPRPYHCLLENIPAFGDQPAHQHIDFVYLASPVHGTGIPNLEEVSGLCWFSKVDLEKLKPELDIFSETLNVIRSIGQFLEKGRIPALNS